MRDPGHLDQIPYAGNPSADTLCRVKAPRHACLHRISALVHIYIKMAATNVGIPRMPITNGGGIPAAQMQAQAEQLTLGERILIGATPIVTVGSLIGLGYPPYAALLRWRICRYPFDALDKHQDVSPRPSLVLTYLFPCNCNIVIAIEQVTTQRMLPTRCHSGKS